MDRLDDSNFLIYCAKHYDNPQCQSTEEFLEDLKRIKYIKKLITRYIETGELKERLILNHLIVLSNVFRPEHLCKILYLKVNKHMKYVKPFIILLNVMPSTIKYVNDEVIINMDEIPMDEGVIRVLRKI
jgi:hypothetical protein